MNSGSLSGGALAVLVAVLIASTEADRKRCDCDLRYSTSRLVAGDSIDSLPVLYDSLDPTYHHWLHVSCDRVNENCPNDCVNRAYLWLGPSRQFGYGLSITGPIACGIVKQNAPPSNKIYVYASYVPSVCGGRSWQYVTELCCWEITSPDQTYYRYNHMCAQECSPLNPGC